MTSAVEPEVADWVTLEALNADPHAVYRRLRDEQPVPWVPVLNRYLVTRYSDAHAVERDPETFAANEDGSLMTRVCGGTPMVRKDGSEHAQERKAAQAPFRRQPVQEHWRPVFERTATALLDDLEELDEPDLVRDFCAPFAARNLRDLIGLRGVSDRDMQDWSDAMIGGLGNYADDPAIWTRTEQAMSELDAVLDELIPHLRDDPDDSMISSMLAGEQPLGDRAVRYTVKMTIGGGLNEPRDALAVALWVLLTNPGQRALVEADETLYEALFQEVIRWDSVVAMYPRQTTRAVDLGGVRLPARARVGVLIGSANRDERQFERPDVFDLHRERKPHLAFGGGPHYCLGAWASRAMISDVALPMIFGRLPDLRLAEGSPRPEIEGWIFRGVPTLPVTWGGEDRRTPLSDRRQG